MTRPENLALLIFFWETVTDFSSVTLSARAADPPASSRLDSSKAANSRGAGRARRMSGDPPAGTRRGFPPRGRLIWNGANGGPGGAAFPPPGQFALYQVFQRVCYTV